MTGIKGTNIPLDLSSQGYGNVFQNPVNGLLFDICYSSGVSNYLRPISASNCFWVGGFANMKFNLLYDCSNAARREIGQYNEWTTQCDFGQYKDECTQILYTSDGLNPPIQRGPIQCFTSGGGSTNALMAKKTDNSTATKADSDKFKIYPNPANETVKLDIESGDYHLRVLNTVGQTIFEQNTEGVTSVNVATWTNGIYLFELTDKATNKQQRSKIIVQH
jgi:hypothetical protein